ncbi:MAG: hypothetical protein ABID54_03585, partial [Pseudomonadota bacterium]
DMLVNDKWDGNIISPMAISRFLNGSLEYQIDVTIDLYAPYFINFFAGWNSYKDDSNVRPIFITFEETVRDQIALIERVADGLDEQVDVDDLPSIISDLGARGGINFNKGVVGRGEAMINSRQITRLRHLAFSLGCDDEKFLGFDL